MVYWMEDSQLLCVARNKHYSYTLTSLSRAVYRYAIWREKSAPFCMIPGMYDIYTSYLIWYQVPGMWWWHDMIDCGQWNATAVTKRYISLQALTPPPQNEWLQAPDRNKQYQQSTCLFRCTCCAVRVMHSTTVLCRACVRVLHSKPFFLPIDMQHAQLSVL